MSSRSDRVGAQRRSWWEPFAVALVLAIALALRLYGWDWDEGYLFHPDERQIFMVVRELSLPWPPDWGNLLSPESTLNPGFFAYGSFPMYLLKLVAAVFPEVDNGWGVTSRLCLFGRPLSALFDVATLALLWRLGRKLYGRAVGMLGLAFGAVAVLHIQLSHFYAVDTILTFFAMWAVSLAVEVASRGGLRRAVPLGIAIGLALATKISAGLLAVTACVAWTVRACSPEGAPPAEGLSLRKKVWGCLRRGLPGLAITGVVSALTFILMEPYALLDMVNFIADNLTQSWMVSGAVDIPYTRQFVGRADYVYELQQLTIWSLGLPLGLASVFGFLTVLARVVLRRGTKAELVLLSWPVVYFGVVGLSNAKFLRYMLPVVPFLLLFGARLLIWLAVSARHRVLACAGWVVLTLVLICSGAYALAFESIYSQRHPWVQATAWICENIPQGARLATEHWDDPLPLTQARGELQCRRKYSSTRMNVYDPDDEEKLGWLVDTIESVEYVVLSSNRLYGTISRLPGRYPITSRYYRLLFGGELGFDLVYHAASPIGLGPVSILEDRFVDPGLPVPAPLQEYSPAPVTWHLRHADESFTVYDHPRPLVFKKVRALSVQELTEMLQGS